MFDTPYNKRISEEVLKINKRYIKHAENEGQMVSDAKMRANVVQKKPLMTGEGIFSSLLSKIGLGQGPEMEAGAIAMGKRKKHMKQVGGNWFHDMTSGISEGMNMLFKPLGEVAHTVEPFLPLVGLGKKQRKIKHKPIKIGLGEPVEGGRRRVRRGGANLYNETLLKPLEGGRRRVRRGKGEEMVTGDGILSGLLGSIGLGKPVEGGRRRVRRGKGEEVVTGGKRKPSKWIEHCKAYAKKHNLKYNEALKDPKCRASYIKK